MTPLLLLVFNNLLLLLPKTPIFFINDFNHLPTPHNVQGALNISNIRFGADRALHQVHDRPTNYSRQAMF